LDNPSGSKLLRKKLKAAKTCREHPHPQLRSLTEHWGSLQAVALYLDRCQIDTPSEIVSNVWSHIRRRRRSINTVVDFGAGDGRFAAGGHYDAYIGYEIDASRCAGARLPRHATMLNRCAFSDTIDAADVCIGNPPFVRNQDLPEGWRKRAAAVVKQRTGVDLSGLANAWQYFAMLALASTRADGLVALIIPYEWVSRPSARSLRDYIDSHRWEVSVYRLRDETFRQVLTTSSITVIDKRKRSGRWKFFAENEQSAYDTLPSPAAAKSGVIPYSRRSGTSKSPIRAKRGLSPGTQEILTLTEGERVRAGLRVDADVIPCVTSLRALDPSCETLTEAMFRKQFRDAGAKCWLIRTNRSPSIRLRAYLDGVPSVKYRTSTCLSREYWWKFSMPDVPPVLAASGFRGQRPKAVVNQIGAIAVGSVTGVFGIAAKDARAIVRAIGSIRVASRIVAHSNGMLKLEIGQFNTILSRLAATLANAS
jgi:hypothetical protein